MAATTNRGWPLPDGASPPDVPYWMDALGQAIDDDLALTDWADVAVSAGFAGQAGAPPQVRKEGKRVSIRWGFGPTGLTGTNVEVNGVGTVPVGFRPAAGHTAYLEILGSTGNQRAMALVNPSGVISIRIGAAACDYYLFSGELNGWWTD